MACRLAGTFSARTEIYGGSLLSAFGGLRGSLIQLVGLQAPFRSLHRATNFEARLLRMFQSSCVVTSLGRKAFELDKGRYFAICAVSVVAAAKYKVPRLRWPWKFSGSKLSSHQGAGRIKTS